MITLDMPPCPKCKRTVKRNQQSGIYTDRPDLGHHTAPMVKVGESFWCWQCGTMHQQITKKNEARNVSNTSIRL